MVFKSINYLQLLTEIGIGLLRDIDVGFGTNMELQAACPFRWLSVCLNVGTTTSGRQGVNDDKDVDKETGYGRNSS